MQYEKIEEEDFIGEIVKDIEDGTCIGRPLFNVKRNPNESGTMFFVPDNIEGLVTFLFDMSLSSNITCVNRVLSDNPLRFHNPDNPSKPRVFAYEIYCSESMDGTTNIDDELIEHLYRAFRQEDCK